MIINGIVSVPNLGLIFLYYEDALNALGMTLFPSPTRGLVFYPVPVSPPAARLCIAFCGAVPATDLLPQFFSLLDRC